MLIDVDCKRGPSGPRTMMHDKLEITALAPVGVPATVTETPVNSYSSISLHSHLPKDYSGDATRAVVPGTNSLLPPMREKHLTRSILIA